MVDLRPIQIGILKYRSVYGLDDVLTLYRGTIRGRFFESLEYVCSAGND
jgi:hypothetical protein